jgi:hypothetical protein
MEMQIKNERERGGKCKDKRCKSVRMPSKGAWPCEGERRERKEKK